MVGEVVVVHGQLHRDGVHAVAARGGVLGERHHQVVGLVARHVLRPEDADVLVAVAGALGAGVGWHVDDRRQGLRHNTENDVLRAWGGFGE